MSIRLINDNLDPDKQPNFYDGQQLNVDDLEQLQGYVNEKNERAVENLGFDGVTRLDGLRVEADEIMVEPFAFPEVPQSSANTSLQNYRDFPEDSTDTSETKIYQVFKAETDNLQRLDLKLQLLNTAGDSVLQIELLDLTVPTNPLSSLSNSLFSQQFSASDIPSSSSDGRLIIDVSNQNDGQGISLDVNSHYAVLIRFIKESGSQDQLRVYHSNVSETDLISSDFYAQFLVSGVYQQGLYNTSAVLVNMVIYHKVYTSAVKVGTGAAYFKGQPIKVQTEQRFLSLADCRNATSTNDHQNYVAIKFVLDSTDPELHPRTNNSVDTRFEDVFEIKVFDETEWGVEVAKERDDQEWFLLASVVDRNVISFSDNFHFSVNERTNLAFNDWLNPCVVTPSLGALNLQTSRPDDFIFFIDNVPTEFPSTDDDGNQEYDSLGQPLTDTLAQVFLILYLDGGTNVQSFELASLSSTPTTPPFSSFYVTITDPEGTVIPGLANYVYDLDEIAPNTFYNYKVVTSRGRSVFIQDYNTQIRTPHPDTGILSLTRDRAFDIRLNSGDITAIINEDLRLGDPIVEYGNVGQVVTGYNSIIQVDEVPGKVGNAASSAINTIADTLLAASFFKFEPLPMCFEDGTLIGGNATDVTAAASADDIVIKIDGVPINWSGTEGPEKGGTGAPHVIEGRILFSTDPVQRQQQIDDLAISLEIAGSAPFSISDLAAMKVTVRDDTGRDNSQQSIVAITEWTGTELVYRVIAMGKGAGSPAGFATGEIGYLYFQNRVAKDVADVPLRFTYTPFGSSILDVRDIEPQEQWFGEREIVYALSSATVSNEEVGIDPITGQVFFNDVSPTNGGPDDLDLIFTQLGLSATIEYFQLDQQYEVVQYYQTRLFSWGDSSSCAIINEDVSVKNAITAGDIVVKVNGLAIFNGIDLSNALNVVASIDEELLDPDQMMLDPFLGKIVFGDNIRPDPSVDVVTITYYYHKPITTCAASALGSVYDVRYDFNVDGRIDETDLNLFLAAYGSSTGDPSYNVQFDFNSDGSVDSNDYDEFLAHFGTVVAGSPLFEDATAARLGSILVLQNDNPLERLQVVRAVSTGPSTEYPLGRTVLFFDSNTPVLNTGSYQVLFGFAATLVTGTNEVVITTSEPIASSVSIDRVEIYQIDDTSDIREVIDIASVSRDDGGTTVYDNTVTFVPSITTTDEYIIRTLWQSEGVAVTNRNELIKPVQYEEKDRRVFGPFKMDFNSSDFAKDGSSIVMRLSTNPEATMADGSVDSTGLHLDGVPITSMRFSILLFVPINDIKVDIWRWHHLVPASTDQGIKLEFNDALSLDTRYKGKNGVPVLQPFGMSTNQVDLRPKYAGGDVENDLSNIVVVRDDFLPSKSLQHNHTSTEEGGVLTSDNITFEDPEARFDNGSVTDVIYELHDDTTTSLNAILAQLATLSLNASQVVFDDTSRGCFGTPSGSINLQDAIYRILDFIAWDELGSC